MPVGELLKRMSSRELTEWMAYYQIEPFGEERDDLRMGILAALIANIFGNGKHHYAPKEFMPRFDGKESCSGGRYPIELLKKLFE